jgi:hypothetical protein
MTKPKEQQLVTLPLDDLIQIILGDDNGPISCMEIPSQTGEILGSLLRHSAKYIVVWDTDTGEHKLWRLTDWQSSQALYARRKARDQHEREQGFIKRANIDNLVRAIQREAPIPDETARTLARKLLEKNNEEIVKFFGVKKLITNIEEVP